MSKVTPPHVEENKQPAEKKNKSLQPTNIFSAISLAYLVKIIYYGVKRPYDLDNLFDVGKRHDQRLSYPKFEKYLNESSPKRSMFLKTLCYQLLPLVLTMVVFGLVSSFQFIGIILLPFIIDYVAKADDALEEWKYG